MASLRADHRVKQLWQLPLLLLSLGLFCYAAYLFIDPRPGLTITQRINLTQDYLRHERPEAAIEQLNKLLGAEKLSREDEARIHLLMAEALDAGQRLNHINSPLNREQIIEQSRIALAEGAKAGADVYRRLGESYEALGKTSEALENFRRAMAMDPTRALWLQRKVIDLQLAQDDPGPAEGSLDEYLKEEKLTNSERAWAMGQKADLLSRRGNFAESRALLNEVLRLDPMPSAQGQAHYRLGYCAWKSGEVAEADRLLRVSREQLKSGHPLDADAAWLLGKIAQDKANPTEAITFYEAVLQGHPGSASAPLSRLGRGVCRIQLAQDEAGLTDLHELVDEIASKQSRHKYKADAVAGLRQASAALSTRSNFSGALEVLTYEQMLDTEPPAEFYGRLASVYERRAEQVEHAPLAPSAMPADRVRRDQQVRSFRTHAGDSYIAYSRGLTLADDQGHADALWKGVDLYDKAGNVNQATSALELFVAERPDDGQTPDALLRLGQTWQAAGQFDKAITAFQRNQFRYPQSLAASKSGVPLAQAYLAKGPEYNQKAEKVLIDVIGSPLIGPDAEEFRQALFELAQLFYRTGRYEEAVARLEEMTERYPNDERRGQLLFLMGDSYRKSATLLVKLASTNVADGPSGAADQAEAAAAKRERLTKARKLFDRVIDVYREAPPKRDLDKLYLKLSHFYRADCVYDLGQFADAIKLYDAATLRYQEDPSALAAYVQIVNAYVAMGKSEEARTANERARWLLRRMPADAFSDGSFSMPKEYWEQWLKWTNDVGMWSKGPTTKPIGTASTGQ